MTRGAAIANVTMIFEESFTWVPERQEYVFNGNMSTDIAKLENMFGNLIHEIYDDMEQE
jgi:hypothetical protein